jgi:hypothetical protein
MECRPTLKAHLTNENIFRLYLKHSQTDVKQLLTGTWEGIHTLLSIVVPFKLSVVEGNIHLEVDLLFYSSNVLEVIDESNWRVNIETWEMCYATKNTLLGPYI